MAQYSTRLFHRHSTHGASWAEKKSGRSGFNLLLALAWRLRTCTKFGLFLFISFYLTLILHSTNLFSGKQVGRLVCRGFDNLWKIPIYRALQKKK